MKTFQLFPTIFTFSSYDLNLNLDPDTRFISSIRMKQAKSQSMDPKHLLRLSIKSISMYNQYLRKFSGQAKAKERRTWRWEHQGLLASKEVLLQPDLVKLLPYALHLLPDPTHL
jgi:hypothetical protein